MDFAHWIGEDLSFDSRGGILPADGILRGQQRVVRRLLTVAGTYWHHLTYGAGVQLDIGEPEDGILLKAKIQQQIFAEPAVAQDPPPQIIVQPLGDTTGFFVQIIYVDNDSGQQTSASLTITP